MAFSRLPRRRRSAILKITLLLVIILFVSYWIYTLKNPKAVSKSSKTIDHSQIFPVSVKRIVPTLEHKNLSQSLIGSNIFLPQVTKSHFQNPALLHKLQGKPPNVIPIVANKSGIDLQEWLKLRESTKDYNFPRMRVTPGLGERGEPVHLPAEEQKVADKVFNEAAFNVYLSDRIAFNRSVPDPRNPK